MILNQLLSSEFDQQTENDLPSSVTRDYLKTIQGECKIQSYQYLCMSKLKLIFFFIPLSLSILGLVLLYHFKKLRVLTLYSIIELNQVSEAEFLYCENKEVKEICEIVTKKMKGKIIKVFKFHQLQYQIVKGRFFPLSHSFEDIIKKTYDHQKGLNEEQIEEKMYVFGKNEHIVPLPSYFQFMFTQLTHPFSLLAYLTIFIYMMLNLMTFAWILLFSILLTLHINYFLVRSSFKKIKQMAEHSHKVQVLRNGESTSIQSSEIVPFDVYIPSGSIPCNSIVLQGELFVSQVGYTGENTPIGKFSPSSLQSLLKSEHWLYEGSDVISSRSCLALAVNTGYSSSKGRILRKIISNKPSNVEFFKNLICLSLELILISVIIFISTYHVMFSQTTDEQLIYLKFADFIVNSIPSIVITYINFLYNFSLARLNNSQNIISTASQKIAESSRLGLVCFDKTGTLTEKEVQFSNFIRVSHNKQNFFCEDDQNSQTLIKMIISTCHGIKIFNGQLRGDQIDLALFQESHSQLEQSLNPDILWKVRMGETLLEVLKFNQFQSQHQSMSVLVRNPINDQHFIFAKGAPQLLHTFAAQKDSNFQRTLRDLSLRGFRTIGLSYKKVGNHEKEKCFAWSRNQFLEQTKFIALATFSNCPKPESSFLLSSLVEAQIQVKMITGDNIYVSVQAALTIGLTPVNKPVLVLEGCNLFPDRPFKAVLIQKSQQQITQQIVQIKNVDTFDYNPYSLAIDGNFLEKKSEFCWTQKSILIFARMSPENKSEIVRQQKNVYKKEFKNQKFSQKWFGELLSKVGMVGDGANDLMAIKEADIGIAINNTDAIHSADFTVQDLSKIKVIITEGRCTEKNLVELVIYCSLYYLLYNVYSVICMTDMATYPALASLLRNLTCFYPLSLFMAFFVSSGELVKHRPSVNFLGLQNQLRLLGNFFICSAATFFSYNYYKNTPYFQPNPDKDSSTLNEETITSTLILLISTVILIGLNFAIVGSDPWKKPFWYNKFSLVVIVLDTSLTIVIFLCSSWFSFLGYKQIEISSAAVTLAILILGTVALIMFNVIIDKLKLYKKKVQNHNE